MLRRPHVGALTCCLTAVGVAAKCSARTWLFLLVSPAGQQLGGGGGLGGSDRVFGAAEGASAGLALAGLLLTPRALRMWGAKRVCLGAHAAVAACGAVVAVSPPGGWRLAAAAHILSRALLAGTAIPTSVWLARLAGEDDADRAAVFALAKVAHGLAFALWMSFCSYSGLARAPRALYALCAVAFAAAGCAALSAVHDGSDGKAAPGTQLQGQRRQPTKPPPKEQQEQQQQQQQQTLHSVLRDPLARRRFREHCASEYAGENLAFWEACEELTALVREAGAGEAADSGHSDSSHEKKGGGTLRRRRRAGAGAGAAGAAAAVGGQWAGARAKALELLERHCLAGSPDEVTMSSSSAAALAALHSALLLGDSGRDGAGSTPVPTAAILAARDHTFAVMEHDAFPRFRAAAAAAHP